MSATSITFNGFNLNDGTSYITGKINHTKMPQRQIEVHNLARAPGAVITNTTYGIKEIPLSGTILGTSQADLETKIDTLNAALMVTNANLDIGFAGSTRRYICTVSKFEVATPPAGAWASFDITLLAVKYGEDTADTTLYSSTAMSTSPTNKTFTFGGSAPQQYLDIVVTISALNASNTGQTRFITLTNPATGEAMTITRIFAAGDVITIKNSDKTVWANGVRVDWTGAFQTYAPEASSITLTHNFTTSQTITATMTYKKRWL